MGAAFAYDKNQYEFGSGTSTDLGGSSQIVPHTLPNAFFPPPSLTEHVTQALYSYSIPSRTQVHWFNRYTLFADTSYPRNDLNHHFCSCWIWQRQAQTSPPSDIWLQLAPKHFSLSDS